MHLPSTMRPLAVAAQAAVLFFAFARIFSAPQGAHAQQTDAVCLSNFSWMENSRGQNPCLVAAYVQGVCNGGQWRVGALSPGRHYIGPYREDADNCQCSSVVYDLVSACGLCQNRIIIAWSTWATNCTTDLQTLGGFPNPIPSGTSIPAWAYLNPVDHNDLFDPDAAQALLSQPESSAPPQASGTRSSSRSPSGTGINAPSISPSSGGGGGSNVGAIVGGVVGGLVGVGLIAVLAFFLLRKKKATAQQNQFTPYQAPQPPLTPYGDQPLMANYQPSSPGGFPNGNNGMYSPPPPSSMQPPFGSERLYDPNDPSTFPATSSTPVSNMGGHSVHTTYGQPQPARPGQYTGVPEL